MNVTDITILIAVIALSLWPLAFLVFRIRHERRKRKSRLDRMTKDDMEDIDTQELVATVLKEIGVSPKPTRKATLCSSIRAMISILPWRTRRVSS